MKREVTFVKEISADSSKRDEFAGPILTLRMRVVSSGDRYWGIDVEIVRERREPPAIGGFYEPRVVRDVVFFSRIAGKEEDALIARAAGSSDNSLALEIMNRLYWEYILKPSMEDYEGPREEENWFKKHARGTWDFHMKSILRDREESVRGVQDA